MFEHRDLRLDNGLNVVLVPRNNLHLSVISLFLRVGSRFETRENNGISHFLEHMVFRGTQTLPSAHEQSLAFERLGGELCGATHIDHGLMSVAVPPENLCKVIALLGDVTQRPRFGEIEVERKIVHEEILEDLDDDGRMIDADNLARELMFPNHPLGLSITGGLSTLKRFDEPMLRAHHAAHYTAENAVLCIAGNLGDQSTLETAINNSFQSMPRGRRVPVTAAATDQTKARFRFVENQSSQTDLRLAFRAPSESDPREPATEMLLRVLDDGMSTRLYERICDRSGLCYDVSGMFETYEDGGIIDIAAGVHHKRAPKVLSEVTQVLKELAEHGPTVDEMEKARNRHRWTIEAMLDDADELAGFYGLAALAKLARSPAARHEELCAVRASDVRDLAADVFQSSKLSGVAVGLLSGAEERRVERVIQQF